MPSTAEQVISRVLRRKATPTAKIIIRELFEAGCVIDEPDTGAPVWLPKGRLGRAAVEKVAQLVNEGLTVDQICTETGRSRRMIDRYIAAACHYKLVERRPQRKARS
ncbi:hypothetical protein SAMN05421874_12868 [Nonomuraea maritima]|uniref:Uncharacterized protein n=1 Tax=Nonomuraea maritima TaxID=683260 RepID=A0A1G9MK65_9ACTN|nr:hypothetical protein [Nonomuraea maritima]SDL74473.1 hypothetical protein SAMN05421874_12868 [Nonomuraea maritima]